MKITIIIDNEGSWFDFYAEALEKKLLALGHHVRFVHTYEEIAKGDVLFLLSCGRIVGSEILSINTNNIVIHASALPKGQGFAPLSWQILAGENKIPITLFEAREKVDSGEVYLRDAISFEGHELRDEMDRVLGEKIVAMAVHYIKKYPMKGTPQIGTKTWYRRRKPADSQLDPTRSIEGQFNLLRIVDSTRFPAYFEHRGHTYELRISKKE